MTVNPDPDEVAAAELAVSNAAAAYKLAQQKYTVNSTDSGDVELQQPRQRQEDLR